MIYFMNYKIYFLRTARNDAILTFGVSSVPRVFLIDPKGVIVAVNLYGEELEQCLEEIFSK